MVDILFRQHFSHIGSAGGIADHSRAAAEQGNGTVACHLKSFHQAECHKVTDMETVGSRIKADVENSLAVVDKLLDFVLVRDLSNKSAGDKLVINRHNNFFLSHKNKKVRCPWAEDELSCYHLCSPHPHGYSLSEYKNTLTL